MEKVMKTVVVFEEDVHYEVPESADSFIEYFQSKINSIPEEFRSAAVIEIEANSRYDDYTSLDLKISYARKETDEELLDRTARVSSEQARSRDRKLLQLASLKRELGVE